MRLATLLVGIFALAGTASPALSYCCWNPAICQAVCGSKCCGADLKFATPVDSRALSNFQIQDLMSTYNQAEARSDLKRLLGEEIKRRGGTVSTPGAIAPTRTP